MIEKKTLEDKWSKSENKTNKAIFEHFIKTAPNSFVKNHYELSNESGVAPEIWKEFLNDPDIRNYVNQELRLVQDQNANKVMFELANAQDATDVSKARQFLALKGKDEVQKGKEFKIYMLPKDVKFFKQKVRDVQIIVDRVMKTKSSTMEELTLAAELEAVVGKLPKKEPDANS